MTQKNQVTHSKIHPAVLGQLSRAKPRVAAAANRSSKRVQVPAQTLTQRHPWFTAGAVLGAGAMVGVVVYQLFGRRASDGLPARTRRAVSRYF